MQTLGQRIAWLREQMGLTQEQLADALSTKLSETATGSQRSKVTRGAIANWETDQTKIGDRNMDAIAELTGATYDWLKAARGEAPDSEALASIGKRFKPINEPAKVVPIAGDRRFDYSVPLYGSVAAGMVGRGAFIMSSDPIDYLPLPPGLAGEKDIYALRVSGTSMQPKFDDGDPIYVSATRQPRKGDIIVVQEGDTNNGHPQSFVKQFDHETADRLVTHQFNPDSNMIFERRHVIHRHRVYTLRELFG